MDKCVTPSIGYTFDCFACVAKLRVGLQFNLCQPAQPKTTITKKIQACRLDQMNPLHHNPRFVLFGIYFCCLVAFLGGHSSLQSLCLNSGSFLACRRVVIDCLLYYNLTLPLIHVLLNSFSIFQCALRLRTKRGKLHESSQGASY